MRDFQLAADLESRAIHLQQEALSHVVLSLGGTVAGGFVKFLVDSFSGSTEYDQAKAQAMLDIPDTQNPDDAELADLDLQQDEATPRAATAKLKDVCPLTDTKPVFPTSEVTISTTGVPKEFISKNMPTGPNQYCYYCLYGDYGASALQKASLCGHICHKHLGVALQCKFCGQAWWTSNPFIPHMQKLHPEMNKPDWFLTLAQAQALQEEAEAAAEATTQLPDKSTQPEVSSSEGTDPAEPPASQNPEKEPSV